MKFQLLIYSFFLTLSFHASAQFDTNKTTFSIAPEGMSVTIQPESPEKKESTATGFNYQPKYSFDPNAPRQPLIQSKKPDLTYDPQYSKIEHTYEPSWLKKEGQNLSDDFTKDQYFGDFRTSSKKLRILCRDHEYVDGDRVQILQNNKIIVLDHSLISSFTVFHVELEEGFNTFEFVALNMGSSNPNTAEFKVIDEEGKTLVHNIWNLGTGVKASIIVINEQHP